MTIANTVKSYLQAHNIPYTVVSHRHTTSSKETVDASHVPAEQLAKAVILGDKQGYLMAVLPSNRRIDVQSLSAALERNLAVVPEHRMGALFQDCEFGAVPPLGVAYGLSTVIDDCLIEQPEIYFEAGDHEEVIHVDGAQFRGALRSARHAQFCQ
jgi:Ala-tRNA(Pro) deacylase